MYWPNVKRIAAREVRDQLRDRRTLFMIAIVPVVLYPGLGLGLIQLTLRFGQEQRRIGVVGAQHLPAHPPLFTHGMTRFAADLFKEPRNQRLYEVAEHAPEGREWTAADLAAGRIHALILVPTDTAEVLRIGGQVRLRVQHNSLDDKSLLASHSVRALLGEWSKALVRERMQSVNRSPDFADPILLEEEKSSDVAAADRPGAIWSKVFPFLLVMMALTGAFYPAVDSCAGEKERGTMETLLITPASRGEIVLGKFLAIFLFSVVSTVCNLTSMGLTVGQISNLVRSALEATGAQFAAPTFGAIAWMFVLMLPLAAFFSALCMALAIVARSTKEGQYYLMPLFLVVTPLVFLTLAPGVELTPFYSLVPVTNVALLLRALLLGQHETAAVYFFPVLIPTVLYSYLALRYAADQFQREEVLFREAERFQPGLWLRRLLREKEPTPGVGEAWFAYVVLLLLLWYSQGRLPPNLLSVAGQQLALIGFPAVLMALLFTSRPRHTLALRWPQPLPTILALVLVVVLHPAAVASADAIRRVLPVPEDLAVGLGRLTANNSWWARWLALALLPAICEELAFRGFLLAGLLRRHPPYRAVLITSVLFGIFHMIPQQMILASLLGVLLGIIVTRTGSILPAMGFHALHNTGILLAAERRFRLPGLEGHEDGYDLVFVLVSALGSALIVGYLCRLPVRLRQNDGAGRDIKISSSG